MDKRLTAAGMALALAFTASAFAKLPPPPPLDEKGKAAAEEKKAKDAAAAEKTKADLAAAEDRAVQNYHANMKKAGKPIPKPVAVATAPKPGDAKAAPAKAAPDKGAAKK